MITEKEYAQSLVEQFFPIVNGGEPYSLILSKAKKCALIVVNKIIESQTGIPIDCVFQQNIDNNKNALEYYQNVVEIIKSL